MASVAGIFINLRRLEGSTAKRILLRSGDPQTHQSVADGCRNAGTVPVEYSDQYVCQGGVNVCTLLRVTRLALLEHCNQMGANALVDEEYVFLPRPFLELTIVPRVRWECRISGPKPAPNGAYKVDVCLSPRLLHPAEGSRNRYVYVDCVHGRSNEVDERRPPKASTPGKS